MSNLRSLAAAVAAITSVFAGAEAMAESASPTRSERSSPGSATAPEAPPRTANSLLLRAGDTVKISIYELVDADVSPPANGEDPSGGLQMSSFFQRVDLSGEYAIQGDGSVALPRLGAVPASGRPVHDVGADIQAAFSKAMGRPADVNLTIVNIDIISRFIIDHVTSHINLVELGTAHINPSYPVDVTRSFFSLRIDVHNSLCLIFRSLVDIRS